MTFRKFQVKQARLTDISQPWFYLHLIRSLYRLYISSGVIFLTQSILQLVIYRANILSRDVQEVLSRAGTSIVRHGY